MKKLTTFLLLFTFYSAHAYAGDTCSHATADPELLQCAEKDFAIADKKLNDAYNKLIKVLDTEGQKKLRDAQRAWVTFRNLNAIFSGDINRGGSAEFLNIVGAKNTMTQDRTKELQSELASRQ